MFDIVDGKVVMNPEDLAIPPFKKIYDSDKSKDKEIAFKKISYIIFMYRWKSPYASLLDEDLRSRVIKKDLFDNEEYELDTLMKDAIERYKQFIYTFSLQFLDQNMLGAKKLMQFYEMINWDDTDKSGKFLYSDRNLAANLKEAGNILRSLESLKDQVRKEELETTKIKGGNEVGLYEDAHTLNSFQYS
jgi:hypothetical protein